MLRHCAPTSVAWASRCHPCGPPSGRARQSHEGAALSRHATLAPQVRQRLCPRLTHTQLTPHCLRTQSSTNTASPSPQLPHPPSCTAQASASTSRAPSGQRVQRWWRTMVAARRRLHDVRRRVPREAPTSNEATILPGRHNSLSARPSPSSETPRKGRRRSASPTLEDPAEATAARMPRQRILLV